MSTITKFDVLSASYILHGFSLRSVLLPSVQQFAVVLGQRYCTNATGKV